MLNVRSTNTSQTGTREAHHALSRTRLERFRHPSWTFRRSAVPDAIPAYAGIPGSASRDASQSKRLFVLPETSVSTLTWSVVKLLSEFGADMLSARRRRFSCRRSGRDLP